MSMESPLFWPSICAYGKHSSGRRPCNRTLKCAYLTKLSSFDLLYTDGYSALLQMSPTCWTDLFPLLAAFPLCTRRTSASSLLSLPSKVLRAFPPVLLALGSHHRVSLPCTSSWSKVSSSDQPLMMSRSMLANYRSKRPNTSLTTSRGYYSAR